MCRRLGDYRTPEANGHKDSRRRPLAALREGRGKGKEGRDGRKERVWKIGKKGVGEKERAWEGRARAGWKERKGVEDGKEGR